VIDETTGQSLDSTLAFFVESEVVTVPEVKNRIHSFTNKEDAMTHARQFDGKLIENPFGRVFVLPEVAQFDKLKVGVPSLPDALPIKLAIFKPIFKENRLDVKVVPFNSDREARNLLSEGSIDAVLCDLPTGIILTNGGSVAQITRNVLRSNPYRPMFAIVASPKVSVQDLTELKGKTIAVPKGASFRFYTEYFFRRDYVSFDNVILKEVEDLSQAWNLLYRGKVSAATLRTPYTEVARAKGLTFLADDRTLPWMSVLLFSQSAIKSKSDAIKRFLFSFEQSVLALNLQSEQYRVVLQEKGGIPPEVRKKFPMPFFEAANAPAKSEVEPVLEWLVEKGLLIPGVTYEDLVNLQFLPNPENVGLAFCCS
jgi:NitT/TauT family transport system substrate-binding protein